MKKMILLFLSVVVSGCATKVTKLGNSIYPPTLASGIVVFATQKPLCDLEEIGLVVTPLKWNQEKAVEDAKVKAAEIGATHIQVIDVKRNIYNDAAINATAYRCK